MASEGLCKYREFFGKVGEGAHSIRIFNIAVIDVLATIFTAFIIHTIILGYIFNIHTISFWWVLIGLFILGIIAHRMFCVRTTIDKLLFRN